MSSPSVSSGSPKAPMRRRRFLLLTVVLLLFVYFFGFPLQLPAYLKDADLSSISRASVAKMVKSNQPPVDEIYGLLNLVTEDHEHQHILSNAVDLDPTKPIDMSVYAAGQTPLDWHKKVDELNEKYPIVVLSKSYCPFSAKAKKLLETYDIQPAPKIIEVDLRDDVNVIKTLLTRLTGHSTFPNILIRGKTIGGSDDLQGYHTSKQLVKMLEQGGATVKYIGSSE